MLEVECGTDDSFPRAELEEAQGDKAVYMLASAAEFTCSHKQVSVPPELPDLASAQPRFVPSRTVLPGVWGRARCPLFPVETEKKPKTWALISNGESCQVW